MAGSGRRGLCLVEGRRQAPAATPSPPPDPVAGSGLPWQAPVGDGAGVGSSADLGLVCFFYLVHVLSFNLSHVLLFICVPRLNCCY